MQRYLLICFFYFPLLCLQNLFAQTRPGLLEGPGYFKPKTAAVLLRGQVINIPDTVKQRGDLLEASIYTLDAEGKSVQPVQVKQDGSFELTVPYTVSLQQLYLSIGEDTIKRLYVTDGLLLQIDYSSIHRRGQQTVVLSGKDKAMNDYLSAYGEERDKFNQQAGFDQQIAALTAEKLSAETFLARMAQLQKKLDSLNTFFFKKNPSAGFEWIIANEGEGLYYANILQFYWIQKLTLPVALMERIRSYQPGFLGSASDLFYHYLHYYATNQWENSQQLPLDSMLYQSLKTHQIKDKKKAAFLRNTASLYAVYQQDRKKGSDVSMQEHELNTQLAIFNKEYFSFFKPKIEAWTRLHSISLWNYVVKDFPGKRGDILLARSLPKASQLPPSKLREEYKKVLPLIRSADALFFTNYYLQKINLVPLDMQQLATAENTGSTGHYALHQLKMGTETQLYYNLSMNGLTMLQQLRETYAGKFLLIDFWATWCGPCFEDFEQAEVLKTKVDQHQIIFIYFCNDSKIEDWKERILEKHLKGTHLFLTAKQSKEIMEKFNFHAYPSYLFIDRQGKISYDIRWIIHDPEKGSAFLNQLANHEKPD